MDRFSWRRWCARLAVTLAVLAWCAAAPAAGRLKHVQGKSAPPGDAVELFAGMQEGQIDVQFIPKDAARAQLLVTNKTGKPLTVKLPEAFAGVPVLAQFPFPAQQRQPGQQNPLQPNPFQPNAQQPNAPQRVGAGPAQPRVFSIAPEEVAQIKVDTVCLDHGNPNPRPSIKYEIKPLAEVSDKSGVAEICAMLGRGEVAQRAAQLAAWHFNNDMSWEKLAGLRDKMALGTKATYTAKEIEAAKQAAEKALELVKQRKQPTAAAQAATGVR